MFVSFIESLNQPVTGFEKPINALSLGKKLNSTASFSEVLRLFPFFDELFRRFLFG